ncbi:hypothetical protein TNCV_3984431 [Trichonephila clavipes]|nr:hypothetical protein TNCV_3984431 [Trichonephila clavipes]
MFLTSIKVELYRTGIVRIIVSQYCCSRVGRDPMTVSRMWNRWVQDGNMERRAGSQRPPITSSREDKHDTPMALTDCAGTS